MGPKPLWILVLTVWRSNGGSGGENNPPWIVKSNCTAKPERTKVVTRFNHQYT